MVLEFLDSFAAAEAVEADEEEAQRIQISWWSNADGRRENNVTREEWREYRLLMKLMQMQL